MKIFIDSANIDEIKKANEWGVIDEVTTNPSLIAKEKDKNKKLPSADFKDIVQEIIGVIDGPISVDVISTGTDEMVKEGSC